MHVFLRHKMECNIFFRYRTWYIVGRTDSICAFTEKYILHGDSSRICYLLHVLCRTNQFGVTKFSFFPGTNTLKKDSRGPRVGSEWGNGSQELVPLCYACTNWLGYDWLLLQADRLLAQSHRIDKLHADTEHKNAKQRPQPIKFPTTCEREWRWNDGQVFFTDPSLK